MGRRISKWIADDGSEHDTEREMVMHEMEAIDAKEIDAFLRKEDGNLPKRHREYTRVLIEWQKYVRASDLDAATPMPKLSPSAELVDPSLVAPFSGNPTEMWQPKDYAFNGEAVPEDDPFAGATSI